MKTLIRALGMALLAVGIPLMVSGCLPVPGIPDNGEQGTLLVRVFLPDYGRHGTPKGTARIVSPGTGQVRLILDGAVFTTVALGSGSLHPSGDFYGEAACSIFVPAKTYMQVITELLDGAGSVLTRGASTGPVTVEAGGTTTAQMVTFPVSFTPLTAGVPLAGQSVPQGGMAYYTFLGTAGWGYEITVTPSSGTPDMFVFSSNGLPAHDMSLGQDYLYCSTGADNRLTIVSSSSGTHWIGVYGWSVPADFRIGISVTAEGTPAVPTGLITGGAVQGSLEVSWNATSGAESYQAYRDTYQGGTFTLLVYDGSGTSFTDSGLTAGTTFWYKARATNANGSSPLCAAESGTTATVAGAPATPAGLTVVAAAPNGFNVSWSATSGAARYEAFRDTDRAGSFAALVYYGSDTAFLDPGPAAGTTCWYRVKAVNAAGESSALSAAVSDKPVVSTLAGGAEISGSADGTGTAARFYNPVSIAFAAPYLYVADTANATIRRIDPMTAAVTTLAGSAGIYGSADGTGTAARFNNPVSIAFDGTHLYVVDAGNSTVRKINPATAVVTTLAGSAGSSGKADGTGTAARFNAPYGIAFAGPYLYVTDTDNGTIRRIDPGTAMVTTLAGSAGVYGSTDGTGTAARFNAPYGIAFDGACLYVTDGLNDTIRKIDPSTADVTTLAGSTGISGSTDGTGTAALFDLPVGIAARGRYLYVTDLGSHTIRRIDPVTAVVTTMAGTVGISGTADGMGAVALFNGPSGICSDGARLYVVDWGNHTVRRIE